LQSAGLRVGVPFWNIPSQIPRRLGSLSYILLSSSVGPGHEFHAVRNVPGKLKAGRRNRDRTV